jgi:hypothetical protein
VFTSNEAAARAQWDGAQSAVWLDPAVGPISPAESYEETPSTVWRGLFFNMDVGRATGDAAVRRAVTEVTRLPAPSVLTTAVAGVPVLLPSGEMSVIEDSDPDALLSGAGWRAGSDGVRVKRGTKLELRLILPALGEAEGDTFLSQQGTWGMMGALSDIQIAGPASFGSGYSSGGALWTGEYELARYDLPIDTRYGWAWPFDSSDVPSQEQPLGLNVSRLSDPGLDALYEQMRLAGDPATLRMLTAQAWAYAERLDVAVWEGPLPAGVLWKGVDGVRACADPIHALRQCADWRVGGASE